ncbi:MAG: hypothetical protein AAF633_00560 [Chloroflexota bacterium]
MRKISNQFGIIPYLLVGVLFAYLGVASLQQVSNYWLFEPQANLDLVRSVAADQATNAELLEVALPEMLLAFLLSAALGLVGVTLPFLYLLNKRLSQGETPKFLVICRQALGIGLWVAICLYLQMNRVLGIAVAVLLAIVFILAEIVFQVRTQAERTLELEGEG